MSLKSEKLRKKLCKLEQEVERVIKREQITEENFWTSFGIMKEFCGEGDGIPDDPNDITPEAVCKYIQLFKASMPTYALLLTTFACQGTHGNKHKRR
jgi:hypothetical protein